MKWLFWVSAVTLGYTYVGYPVWLYLCARWRIRPVHCAHILPFVSIVTVVHDEAEVLPRKLANLAALDYPADRYEIIAVSDGSTDATNEILAAWADGRSHLVIFSRHEGKASGLNRGIKAARGEIVVFGDARQVIAPDAVTHLVANFADGSVGCVSGELVLEQPGTASSGSGVSIYWEIEKKVRQWESATGSVVGATGALYAVRRSLVVPLPPEVILDDVYLPLRVVREGQRTVFEPRARAYDRVATGRREFRRKVRTLTGNYQLLQLAPWLLTPANPVLFRYVSHKLLRLLTPFALLGVLVSSLVLTEPFYRVALAVQILFYGLAALGSFRPRPGLLSRLASASLAFLLLNTAAAVALIYFVGGKKAIWVR